VGEQYIEPEAPIEGFNSAAAANREICLSARNVMGKGVGELRRLELHIVKVGAARVVCEIILNSQPLAT
jgi:hypothetical protein